LQFDVILTLNTGHFSPLAYALYSDAMRTERLAVPLTTTAAEGLPRRYFTFAELEEMTAAGILGEDERIELIGGEIVPMSPRGEQHEMLRTALNIIGSANYRTFF
jgi:hypothetical protein